MDFNRNWVPYREGFGYLSPDDTTDFWLGLEKMHLLTNSVTLPYVLRIEMVDWMGNKKYSQSYLKILQSPSMVIMVAWCRD